MMRGLRQRDAGAPRSVPIGLVLLLGAWAFASRARGDAVGPEPAPIICPGGAFSAIAGWGGHGQRAYCAPLVAPLDACREGFRAEVVGLSIGGLATGGGHGVPRAATDAATLARVEGPCEPVASEPVRSSSAAHALGAGPSIVEVPVGCRLLRVWVEDPNVHCTAAAGTLSTSPMATSAPPASRDREAASAAPVDAPRPASWVCALASRSGPHEGAVAVALALVLRARRRARGSRACRSHRSGSRIQRSRLGSRPATYTRTSSPMRATTVPGASLPPFCTRSSAPLASSSSQAPPSALPTSNE